MSARPPAPTRADFRLFREIPTRWHDNDAYGHVNNVVYYAYFDTVVNAHLIETGCLDIARSEAVGLVAETGCRYHRSVAFPDLVTAGLRVTRLGATSVRYEIALFRNEEDTAAADGHFVHVYVDRASGRPTPLPAALRAALDPLVVPGPAGGPLASPRRSP